MSANADGTPENSWSQNGCRSHGMKSMHVQQRSRSLHGIARSSDQNRWDAAAIEIAEEMQQRSKSLRRIPWMCAHMLYAMFFLFSHLARPGNDH